MAYPGQQVVSTVSVNIRYSGNMLLRKGEKIHVVHRRLFEKDTRKHFVGEVEDCEHGVIRAVGNVFVIEDVKENVFRRKPERRTRIIRIDSSVFVNVCRRTSIWKKLITRGAAQTCESPMAATGIWM